MACGLRTHAFPCVVESAPLALTTDDRNVEATNELAARGVEVCEHERRHRLTADVGRIRCPERRLEQRVNLEALRGRPSDLVGFFKRGWHRLTTSE